MKYRSKETVDVYTFEDLVEHGRKSGCEIVNGMPWCFDFFDTRVTHENDECYLVDGMVMTPDRVLIVRPIFPNPHYVECISKIALDNMFEQVNI